MKNSKRKGVFVIAAFFAVLVVFSTSPVAAANINYGATDDLLSVLQGLYPSYGITAADQVSDRLDQIWQNIDGNATAMAKYAGFTSDFGFFTPDGSWNDLFRTVGHTGSYGAGGPSADLGSASFPLAWGLKVYKENSTDLLATWCSIPSENVYPVNADNYPSGIPEVPEDHMATFKLWDPDLRENFYVIGWEDLPFIGTYSYGSWTGGCDFDYSDLVVEIRDCAPVPIPGAVWLLGSCMIGLLGIKRRIRK